MDRIRARTTELGNDLVDRARDAGFEVKSPEEPEKRAGIVMIRHPDPARTVQELAREDIIVDYRHDRVRASPYFYNTPEDNARIIDAMKRFR